MVASSYSCKIELACWPNAGMSHAGPHSACLTAAVDFDRPVKLLLVGAPEFLLPPIADRAPRRSSKPANVTRLLPTQGPHIASSTAAVEIDRPVAHLLTRRHEEQHTQPALAQQPRTSRSAEPPWLRTAANSGPNYRAKLGDSVAAGLQQTMRSLHFMTRGVRLGELLRKGEAASGL